MAVNVYDYKIGDRVQNCASRDKPVGVVVALVYEGVPHVVVEFPPPPSAAKQQPWRGAYNGAWLRIQEPVGGLRPIPSRTDAR